MKTTWSKIALIALVLFSLITFYSNVKRTERIKAEIYYLDSLKQTKEKEKEIRDDRLDSLLTSELYELTEQELEEVISLCDSISDDYELIDSLEDRVEELEIKLDRGCSKK